jgi:hypothetical protein
MRATCFPGNCASGGELAFCDDCIVSFHATEKLSLSRSILMRRKPKYPQLANVVFLDKVGETLRQATADITREELPEDILLLLRRLERLERKESLKRQDDQAQAQAPGGSSGR